MSRPLVSSTSTSSRRRDTTMKEKSSTTSHRSPTEQTGAASYEALATREAAADDDDQSNDSNDSNHSNTNHQYRRQQATARQTDDVHEQLRQLKAENTLLGTIIQQLQVERKSKSHLHHESSTALSDLQTKYSEVSSTHSKLAQENSEMKDALICTHKELEEQQTAHRLLKLSSHRQIADVVSSWKAEVAQKDVELKELRMKLERMEIVYGDEQQTYEQRDTNSYEQLHEYSSQSRSKSHLHTSNSDRNDDEKYSTTCSNPFTNQQQPQQSSNQFESSSSTQQIHSHQPQSHSQQTVQPQPRQSSLPAKSFQSRMSLLELRVEHLSRENTQLHQRLHSEVDTEKATLLARLESALEKEKKNETEIYELKAALFQSRHLLNQYKIKDRMEASKEILDKIRKNEEEAKTSSAPGFPKRLIAPPPVTSSTTIATSTAGGSNKQGQGPTKTASDESADAWTMTTQLLQNELKQERMNVNELRTLYELSHHSTQQLRAQLLEQVEFNLKQTKQIKGLHQTHMEEEKELIQIQEQFHALEQTYHHQERELLHWKQLLQHQQQHQSASIRRPSRRSTLSQSQLDPVIDPSSATAGLVDSSNKEQQRFFSQSTHTTSSQHHPLVLHFETGLRSEMDLPVSSPPPTTSFPPYSNRV